MRPSLFLISAGWAALALGSRCKPSPTASSSVLSASASLSSFSASASSASASASLASVSVSVSSSASAAPSTYPECASEAAFDGYTYMPEGDFTVLPNCYEGAPCIQVQDLVDGGAASMQQTLSALTNPAYPVLYTVSFDYEVIEFGNDQTFSWTLGSETNSVSLITPTDWASYSYSFGGPPGALSFEVQFTGTVIVNIANLAVNACSGLLLR